MHFTFHVISQYSFKLHSFCKFTATQQGEKVGKRNQIDLHPVGGFWQSIQGSVMQRNDSLAFIVVSLALSLFFVVTPSRLSTIYGMLLASWHFSWHFQKLTWKQAPQLLSLENHATQSRGHFELPSSNVLVRRRKKPGQQQVARRSQFGHQSHHVSYISTPPFFFEYPRLSSVFHDLMSVARLSNRKAPQLTNFTFIDQQKIV